LFYPLPRYLFVLVRVQRDALGCCLDPSAAALQRIEEVVVERQRLEGMPLTGQNRPRRRDVARAELKTTDVGQSVRIRPPLRLYHQKAMIMLELVRPK
jgi:hypothetical protein